MRKKIIFLISILSLVFYNIEAQKITDEKFKYNIIGEDFIKKQENFPIVRETENYFIIDENEYLIIRENNESDYAIVLDESLSKNLYIKTSIKLGPSENENSSLGIILKANKNFSQALIFEINNKGKYRIKELTNNTYKYLSNKKNRWIKNKFIKKENLYNNIEIICENDKIKIFVNKEILKEIIYKNDETSYSGILIGPDTKARIKYFFLNTDLKQENKSTFINTAANSNKEVLKKDLQKIEFIDSISQINKELEKTIINLRNGKSNLGNSNSSKELENKLEKTLKELESKENELKKIEKKNSLIIESNQKDKIKIQEEIINLNEKLKALAFEKKNIEDELLRKTEKIDKLENELKSEKSINNTFVKRNENIKELLLIKSKKIEELNTKNNSEKLLISSLKTKHKQNLTKLNKELEILKTENKKNIEEQSNIYQKLVTAKKEGKKNKVILLDNSKKINAQIALINNLENELIEQKENVRFLKDLFVYKDFELNGINPQISISTTEKEIEKENKNLETQAFYTIQLGVFLYPSNKFDKLKLVDKSINKNIYTYFYGNFDNISDANINLKKLEQKGLKDIFIIKNQK